MASFTFAPTSDVPASVLGAKSTFAKVRIEPIDAYVNAELRRVPGSSRWTASVESVPQSRHTQLHDHQAVLCLSKGELGTFIGSIDLGHL